MYPLVTLEDAKKVASVLLKDSRLCGVEVFGSVARHGKGHDLDLILLVQNRALATDFILQTNKAIDTEIAASDILSRLEDSIPSSPHSAYDFNLREKVAITLFGKDFEDLLDQAHRVIAHTKDDPYWNFDIFVLSRWWRDEIQVLAKGFPQGDPNFWSNAKREAIRL